MSCKTSSKRNCDLLCGGAEKRFWEVCVYFIVVKRVFVFIIEKVCELVFSVVSKAI